MPFFLMYKKGKSLSIYEVIYCAFGTGSHEGGFIYDQTVTWNNGNGAFRLQSFQSARHSR